MSFKSLAVLPEMFNVEWKDIPFNELEDLFNYCKLFLLPEMDFKTADLIYESHNRKIHNHKYISGKLCSGINMDAEKAAWFNSQFENTDLPFYYITVE